MFRKLASNMLQPSNRETTRQVLLELLDDPEMRGYAVAYLGLPREALDRPEARP